MIHRKSLVAAVVVVLVVVAATAVQPAGAHMAFRCPEPQSPDEGLKTNPCGGYKSTDPVTTLSPGPMTVVWEEVVNHIGTPFRIQLVVFGSDGETVLERYTLRDHIPHNDDPFDEDPKYYFFNIDIPDIECIPGSSVCRLQIINPMTDKTTNGCGDADSDDPDCFSVYHSCANVAITGSNEISEYEHVYSPPDGWRNPTPNWWSKDESGVWNNGWLAGDMLANWQHDVCDTALFGSVVPKYPLTRPPVTANPGSPTTGGAGTTTGDGLGGAHGQNLITAADDGNGLVVVVYLLTAVLVGVGAITIHRLLRKLDARDVAL